MLKEQFKQQGLILTRQRKVILDIVKKMDTHPTADQIYDEVREIVSDISLGTIYRNLNVLKDQSFVHETIHKGIKRYCANMNPHHHILCIECGTMKDVNEEHLINQQKNQQIENNTGFQLLGETVLFQGICPECLNTQK